MKRYLPQVDQSACVAHGDCALVAPGAFRVGDAAEVVGGAPPEAILEAARSCPTGAISVIDSDTGEPVHP